MRTFSTRSVHVQNTFPTIESNRYGNVTHCVFDLDGTIINSEDTYHKILRQICKGYGATYSLQLQNELYGATDLEICTAVVNRLKLPITPHVLILQMKKLGKKCLPQSPLLKGAKKLLLHLHNKKIPMALVTNSTKEDVGLHEKMRPKLFGLFAYKVCSNDPDVTRPKPHPDPYLTAVKRFNSERGELKPEQCLAFEDSPLGVKSAVAAKMQVVMIPYKRLDHKQTELATLVVRSLVEFKPETFGLPPFTNQPLQ